MNKALVAYFSASGTTAKAAKILAKAVGTDPYEIKPAVPYTSADLNWMDKHSRSSLEMGDPSFRPPLADYNAPVANYDVIFLASPSGGMWPPPSSIPSWKVTTSPVRPSCSSPPPAAVDWARRRPVCVAASPVPGFWTDGCSTDGSAKRS